MNSPSIEVQRPEAECFKCKKKGHIAAVCKDIKWLNAESPQAEVDPVFQGIIHFFEPTSSRIYGNEDKDGSIGQ